MAKQSRAGKGAAARTQTETFTAIQDTREISPWSFSKSKVITDITIAKLDVGDYSIAGLEDKVAIERKGSTAEIANNFTETRWPGFLERMQAMKYKFIICEFDWLTVLDFPYGSGIPPRKMEMVRVTPAFLVSCISKIQLDLQIPFIFAGSRAGAEAAAEGIMKRIYKLEKK